MQFGIVYSQEKQEALVLRTTNSKVLHPSFIHFAHTVGCRLYCTLRSWPLVQSRREREVRYPSEAQRRTFFRVGTRVGLQPHSGRRTKEGRSRIKAPVLVNGASDLID